MDGYNNTLYGFAFAGCSRILYRLRTLEMCYIVWSNNVNHYLDILLHDQPKYIVGLGTYADAGRDATMHIETVTTNQFQDKPIELYLQTSESIAIKPFLKPINQDIAFATTLGNSLANLISWKIMRLIHQKRLRSTYTFLHIPKYFSPYKATAIIDELLKSVA